MKLVKYIRDTRSATWPRREQCMHAWCWGLCHICAVVWWWPITNYVVARCSRKLVEWSARPTNARKQSETNTFAVRKCLFSISDTKHIRNECARGGGRGFIPSHRDTSHPSSVTMSVVECIFCASPLMGWSLQYLDISFTLGAFGTGGVMVVRTNRIQTRPLHAYSQITATTANCLFSSSTTTTMDYTSSFPNGWMVLWVGFVWFVARLI